MRIAFAAVLIALSLLASPALAKGQEGGPGFFASIPRNFLTGANHYFQTVGGWFTDLLELLGLSERLRIAAEDDACMSGTRCAIGLVCVNVCEDAACDTFGKRCVKGPSSVQILGEFSVCGDGNLCADGTACTRTCAPGSECGAATHRCLRPSEPQGSCRADDECRASCAKLPFMPIGPSAWVATCRAGACDCAPVEINPALERIRCPDGLTGILSCPVGTREACAPGAAGPYLTCLTAPAYGGICFTDAGCGDAACPEGSSPFCEPTEQACRCRSSETTTIACATADDCVAASACAADQIASCLEGACACAQAGVTTACTTAADCSSDCPEGFGPACTEGACACQRVTENVPIACGSVDDCGGVSCPEGFDKACIDGNCACTRTVTQE